MQTNPSLAPELVEPPSMDKINAYVADLCKAMESDLKDAEEYYIAHRKKILSMASYKRELTVRASRHLQEAVAFYMGCWARNEYWNVITPCAQWERFCALKIKVESYVRDIWKES